VKLCAQVYGSVSLVIYLYEAENDTRVFPDPCLTIDPQVCDPNGQDAEMVTKVYTQIE
jgi:hypothetical protein